MHDSLTWLDLTVAILFGLFIIRGAWIGFIRQLAAFFALVGSYVIAARYVAQALPYTERFVDNPKVVFLVSFVGLFLVSAVGFSLLGRLLHKLMQVIFLDWFNRLLGMILGAIKAALIASLLYMVLASTLSSTSSLLERSVCAPFLKQGAQVLQALINDPKLREYFKENTPAIPRELMNGEKPGEGKEAPKEGQAANKDGAETPPPPASR